MTAPSTPYILSILQQALVQSAAFMMLFVCSGLAIPEGVKFDPALHLTCLDVAGDYRSNPFVIKLHLKYSHTDAMGKGVDLFLARMFNYLCFHKT